MDVHILAALEEAAQERATEDDKRETEEIIRILKVDFNQYEDKADTRNRESILAKLNKIIKEWI